MMSPSTREPTQGWYVYGIVESDVQVQPDSYGVGDPPAAIELVPSGQIAALVSPIDVDRPLGTEDDLVTHEEILDVAATEVPVLPMRFGAVVASRKAVVSELLEPYRGQRGRVLRALVRTGQGAPAFGPRRRTLAIQHL